MMDSVLSFFKPHSVVDMATQHFASLLQGTEFTHELHTIETEDGYLLTMFRLVVDEVELERIKKKRAAEEEKSGGKESTPEKNKVEYKNIGKGRVILMQHGLIDSADSWVINHDYCSPAFFLSRMGFDVWLGNNRGNKYSKLHKAKNDDSKYWDFSFQEMGRYDIPAMIKKITYATGCERLSYIGHSQGTSQMFAALTDPLTAEYVNSKLDLFIALAPIVFLVVI